MSSSERDMNFAHKYEPTMPTPEAITDRREATRIRNPKPNASGVAPAYHYYAGFSVAFVDDVLDDLRLPESATVLDPWNGSGTTTEVVARRHLRSIGFDINPAAGVLARARLATAADLAAARRHVDALSTARIHDEELMHGDLLGRWFGPRTAAAVRGVQRAIASMTGASNWSTLTADAAILYVGLFHAVREMLRERRTTNPTWTRLARAERRLGMSPERVRALFVEAATALLGRVRPHSARIAPQIATSSSLRLPLEDESVNAIIASPPYCTRIDYAVATLPELAVLRFTEGDLRQLRDAMIGTPTVARPAAPGSQLGALCERTLRQIREHRSKDSEVYYHKVYRSYFDRMAISLRELRRVLADGGRAVLVVQDSYYKDLHIDLQAIVTEMAAAAGCFLDKRVDFAASHAWSDIHPGVHRYRSRTLPLESVLFLTKHG